MTSITIPDSVTSIGSSVFSGCTNLETITIPKNASFSLYGGTFDNCTSLKNVIFSSGIEKIPDYLFYRSSNLNSLTSIIIPDSVTTIGNYAFNGCTNLTIYCYPNSYAETYAKSNNIPYKYLEEKPKISITPVISVSAVQVSENAADSDVIAAIRNAATVSFWQYKC